MLTEYSDYSFSIKMEKRENTEVKVVNIHFFPITVWLSATDGKKALRGPLSLYFSNPDISWFPKRSFQKPADL